MIAWTIEAALESKVFDHVFVSADCENIANIARKFGAEVPFLRPGYLATDEATTNDVVTHLVEWFEQHYKCQVTTVAILQPTSPLRNARHIREATELMQKKAARAVVSVCELEHSIQFCNKLGQNGEMEGFIKSENIKRTQDLEPWYRLNGAIYIFNRSYVGRLNELYSKGTFSYVMNSSDSIDVDVEGDFQLVQGYMKLREN